MLAATRRTERNCDDTCGRPDCGFPGHASEKGLYTVEKIVGRKPQGDSKSTFMWLVKWLRFVIIHIGHCTRLISYGVTLILMRSYSITLATWEPEEGLGNLAVLIKRFNQDAMEEGLDPIKDEFILLNEAVQGGWLG